MSPSSPASPDQGSAADRPAHRTAQAPARAELPGLPSAEAPASAGGRLLAIPLHRQHRCAGPEVALAAKEPGQPADAAFLQRMLQQVHGLGGVLHHNQRSEIHLLADAEGARAYFDHAPKRPRILLASDATRCEALQQFFRLRHYAELGRDHYRIISPLMRSQGAFERLARSPFWEGFAGAERLAVVESLIHQGGDPCPALRTKHRQLASGGGGIDFEGACHVE